MKQLIVIIWAAVILISLWGLIITVFYFTDRLSKEHIQKWAEISISAFTFIALFCAGIFGFFKYDDFKKESNYQKVMTRYVDDNIDKLIPLLSEYTTETCVALNTLASKIVANEIPTTGDRIKTYEILSIRYRRVYVSLHKTLVFDPLVFKCLMSVIRDSEIYLKEFLLSDSLTSEQTEDIRIKRALIQNQARFTIYNLQDIAELLSKNIDLYDKPNLEALKNTENYKRILKRFNEYLILWEKMIKSTNAKERFENSVAFFDFLSKYLDNRGIPSEKLIIGKK